MIFDRKGMLLASETLKIVLSIISISLLAFLLFSLYYSGTQKQKEVFAEETMERISEVFSSLNVGFSESVDAMTPSGWSLFSFVNEEKKPNQCLGTNCICICDGAGWKGVLKNGQVKECSNDGFCYVEEDLIKFEDIKIQKGGKTSVLIERFDEGIKVREI